MNMKKHNDILTTSYLKYYSHTNNNNHYYNDEDVHLDLGKTNEGFSNVVKNMDNIPWNETNKKESFSNIKKKNRSY